MSLQCEICHKKAMRGNLVSHSKQRTHRSFKPNLHKVKTLINGATASMRVCTKCLRRYKKPNDYKKVVVEEVKKVAPVKEVVKEVAKEVKVTPAKEVKVKTTTIAELMKESAKEEPKEEVKEERKTAVKEKKTKTVKKTTKK